MRKIEETMIPLSVRWLDPPANTPTADETYQMLCDRPTVLVTPASAAVHPNPEKAECHN